MSCSSWKKTVLQQAHCFFVASVRGHLRERSVTEGTFDYPSVFVRRALAREEIAYGRKDKKQWEADVQELWLERSAAAVRVVRAC